MMGRRERWGIRSYAWLEFQPLLGARLRQPELFRGEERFVEGAHDVRGYAGLFRFRAGDGPIARASLLVAASIPRLVDLEFQGRAGADAAERRVALRELQVVEGAGAGRVAVDGFEQIASGEACQQLGRVFRQKQLPALVDLVREHPGFGT